MECPYCNGSGRVEIKCKQCRGTGWVNGIPGGVICCDGWDHGDCKTCNGTGLTIESED